MSKENLTFHTFGCKVNTYDTGLMQQQLSSDDYKNTHIFNTCAVTGEATKDAIRSIKKIKKNNPNCNIIVTGCSAQVDTDKFENLSDVDLVVANSHKDDLSKIISSFREGNDQKIFKSNIFKKSDFDFSGGLEKDHTRSFLKIQDGCNSFCTYCVIPFTRGKSRSISKDQIIKKIIKLESLNINEVVITGIHLGDYKDGDTNLAKLLKEILKFTSLSRVRLTSLEPGELTDELKEVIKDSRICAHFHMSIQSANDEVLKLMKRNYDYSQVKKSLTWINDNIKSPFVGMDVIVGFPNETSTYFQDTYDKLNDLPWSKIHVFPYSVRPSTYAARLEDLVAREEKVRRSKKLRQLSLHRNTIEAQKQVGSKKQILALTSKDNQSIGLSSDYWTVTLDRKLTPGQIAEVKVQAVNLLHASSQNNTLKASLI